MNKLHVMGVLGLPGRKAGQRSISLAQVLEFEGWASAAVRGPGLG